MKHFKTNIPFLIALLIFVVGVTVACQDGQDQSDIEAVASVEKTAAGEANIRKDLEPTSITINIPGETYTVGEAGNLFAIASFPYGVSDLDITYEASWSSSEPEVLSIIENRVKAKKLGSTIITVGFQGLEAKVEVKVVAAKIEQIALLPKEQQVVFDLENGVIVPKAAKFKALAIKSDGTFSDVTDSVTWSFFDHEDKKLERDFAIDAKGELTLSTEESFKIRAAYDGTDSSFASISSKKAEVTASSIKILTESLIAPLGEALPITIEVTFSDNSKLELDKYFSLEVFDTGARVIDQYNLLGDKLGTFPFTLKYEEVSIESEFYVSNAELVEIELIPGAAAANKGTQGTFEVLGVYSDGSKRSIERLANFTNQTPSIIDIGTDATTGFPKFISNAVGTGKILVEFAGASTTFEVLSFEAKIESLYSVPSSLTVKTADTTTFDIYAKFTDGTVSSAPINSAVSFDPPIAAQMVADTDDEIKGLVVGDYSLSVSLIDPSDPEIKHRLQVPISITPPTVTGINFVGTDTCPKYVPVNNPVGALQCFHGHKGETISIGKVLADYSDGTDSNLTQEDIIVSLELLTGEGVFDDYKSPGTLTVSSSGNIRLITLEQGHANVKVQYQDEIITARVYVKPKIIDENIGVSVQRVSYSGTENKITKTDSAHYRAIATFTDGSSENVTLPGDLWTTQWFTGEPDAFMLVDRTTNVAHSEVLAQTGVDTNDDMSDDVWAKAAWTFNDVDLTPNRTDDGDGLLMEWTDAQDPDRVFQVESYTFKVVDSAYAFSIKTARESTVSTSALVRYTVEYPLDSPDTDVIQEVTGRADADIQTTCPSPGYQHEDGYWCYYLGAKGQSCNDVCNDVDNDGTPEGYDYMQVTESLIGASATDGQQLCREILTSDRYNSEHKRFNSSSNSTDGIGCGLVVSGPFDPDEYFGFWEDNNPPSDLTTTGAISNSITRRLCVCDATP